MSVFRRIIKKSARLEQLDAFPKVAVDYKRKTTTGGSCECSPSQLSPSHPPFQSPSSDMLSSSPLSGLRSHSTLHPKSHSLSLLTRIWITSYRYTLTSLLQCLVMVSFLSILFGIFSLFGIFFRSVWDLLPFCSSFRFTHVCPFTSYRSRYN